MKFSLNAILAASAIFAGAIATGTQAGQAASNKVAASSGQTTTTSASDVLSSCVSQIKVYTAKINSTCSALPNSPSSAQQSAAITSIKAELNDIVDIITSTTTKVGKCSKTNVALQPLINHSEEILFEVFGTLQGAVTKIGSNTLTLLGNPVTSVENGLSSLLVSVEDVHSGVVKVAWGACNNIISSHFSGVATPILAIGSTLSSECSCTH
ncbi:hypothetical protein DIS24_g10114 [Lasiodiplodia hormozganensis]|uniref:Uncharacterized protein n=1 Tax=Lasiodiplodia hormozganensis TaxID=869390 RepID=A0AA40CI70_9PEZI|nr:hypothetical protein DIS24_g10114 [Lasiodiplodia hormozganensis]